MKKPIKKQRMKRYFVSYASTNGVGSVVFSASSLTLEIIKTEINKLFKENYVILFFTEIK